MKALGTPLRRAAKNEEHSNSDSGGGDIKNPGPRACLDCLQQERDGRGVGVGVWVGRYLAFFTSYFISLLLSLGEAHIELWLNL